MPPLSGRDHALLIVIIVIGSLFFVAVCAGVYFIFQRLQRDEDEQDRKDAQPAAPRDNP
jgi:flagellar basal body-associated protein FliL